MVATRHSSRRWTERGNCDTSERASATATKALYDAGITLTVSSGNDSNPTRIEAPACNTTPIARGAVLDPSVTNPDTYFCTDTPVADKVTCFSNASAELDLLAPGVNIRASGLRSKLPSGLSTFDGTSQAAPAVAGTVVLMKQCNPSLTPDQIRGYLTSTGVAVTDLRSGTALVKPRLNGKAALEAACSCLGRIDGSLCTGGTCQAGICVTAGRCRSPRIMVRASGSSTPRRAIRNP